jgi:hypothetical protein
MMVARILLFVLAASVAVASDAPGPYLPAAGAIEFAPRYPLWSDGMDKRRWIHIPAGAAIDKSDADAWEFPRGTRAWKKFSRDGAPNETRLIERLPDGSWRYLTYAWNAAGTEATLAPEEGIRERGIPSRADCLACHEGGAVPIQVTARCSSRPSCRRRSAICTATAATATTKARCRRSSFLWRKRQPIRKRARRSPTPRS